MEISTKKAVAQRILSTEKPHGESTKGDDRLSVLLAKTEEYSRFLFQPGTAGRATPGKYLEADGKQSTGKPGSVVKRRRTLDEEELNEIVPSDDDISVGDELIRVQAQPTCMAGGTMRPYQIGALNWMIGLHQAKINGILADEMGLGKTIEVISLLAFLREFKNIQRNFLVVVPKSTLGNWCKEFNKWCPDINVVKLKATKDEREDTLKNKIINKKFDVCVTTYQGLTSALSDLKKIHWEYFIIDEAHSIKNEESQLAEKCRKIKANNRLLMTGTPLQNNIKELWALLNFILPELFSSHEEFDEWFNFDKEEGAEGEALTPEEKEERTLVMVKKLHKILRPFILRRTKAEVEKKLPPKTEIYIEIGMTETQRKIYKSLLLDSSLENSDAHYNNTLMQLRKCCNHPYLFQGIEPKDAPIYGEHIVTVSEKMIIMDKLLPKFMGLGSKILIFSQMTKVLDIIEDYMIMREYDYCRIDGGTDYESRETQMEDFNDPNNPKKVFLLTTRAGGLGINLIGGNVVIIYDSDFNPQVDLQAMDRAHRIGQTKQVMVYRFITQHTIEEKIIERQVVRLKMDSLIIQSGRQGFMPGGSKQAFGKGVLKEMMQFGANEIFSRTSQHITDEDIDALLEKGTKKAQQMAENVEEQLRKAYNLKKYDIGDFKIDTVMNYVFEDEDYTKKRRQREEDAMRQAIQEHLDSTIAETRNRERGDADYNVDKKFNSLMNQGIARAEKAMMKKKVVIKPPKYEEWQFVEDGDKLSELMLKVRIYLSENKSTTRENMELERFGLTEEEAKLKSHLFETSFTNWTKKEFNAFVQGIKVHGRKAYLKISEDIGTKNLEDVQEYAEVFWAKLSTLSIGEKIEKSIEKKEKEREYMCRIGELIRRKVQAYEDPRKQMKFKYVKYEREVSYVLLDDVALICYANIHGYGQWGKIRNSIAFDPYLRFRLFLKTRNNEDLKQRVDNLVRNIDKEEKDRDVKIQKKLEKQGVQADEEIEDYEEEKQHHKSNHHSHHKAPKNPESNPNQSPPQNKSSNNQKTAENSGGMKQMNMHDFGRKRGREEFENTGVSFKDENKGKKMNIMEESGVRGDIGIYIYSGLVVIMGEIINLVS